MKFRAFFESKDSIPREIADHYRPAVDADGLPAGAYVLDIELPAGWSLRDTSKFDTSLATAKQERRAAQESLDRLRSDFDGIDPAEVGRMKKKLADMEAAGTDVNARAAAAHAAQIAELKAAHKAEMDVVTAKAQAAEADVNKLHHRTSVADAIGAARGNREKLAAYVRSTTRVETVVDPKTKEAKRVTVVVDEDGNTRQVIDTTTGDFRPMTVQELLADMKKGAWATDFEPEKVETGTRVGANIADPVGSYNGRVITRPKQTQQQSAEAFNEFMKNPAAGLSAP